MRSMIPMINPKALHQAMGRGDAVSLLDVRSVAEYADGHAAGAVNIPLEQVDPGAVAKRLGAESGTHRPLYLICTSGQRAEQAAHKLRSQGLKNLTLVDGGTEAWQAHQLPVKRSATLPSLERQTQIVLGVIILAILAKGSLLHPLFFALAGLLGIGLIVAGVTARCGLSMILARMPWNRAAATQTQSTA